MGAQAAHALLARYGAFTGRRMAIVGSGTLALETAELARNAGIEVVALVELGDRVQGDAKRAASLGMPLFTSHSVVRARGTTEVDALEIARIGEDLQPVAGSERSIACDSIVLALGVVPSVELAALSGCRLGYDGGRGGWIPERDDRLETSVPGVFAAGDAGGILQDDALAEAEGRRAGLAAAGAPLAGASGPGQRVDSGGRWLKAQIACSGLEVLACLCEEVSRRELLGVSPPRYLGAAAAPGLDSLAAATAPHPDLLKRLTRAGMGHCQGRRCREQVALLLADAAGIEPSAMPCASYRPPIRPIPLRILQSAADEPGQPWAMWFHPVKG
jgi:NADPH-dependent 2,4-dienoyl-CoA reductase/sulfur reductase-like enzyme